MSWRWQAGPSRCDSPHAKCSRLETGRACRTPVKLEIPAVTNPWVAQCPLNPIETSILGDRRTRVEDLTRAYRSMNDERYRRLSAHVSTIATTPGYCTSSKWYLHFLCPITQRHRTLDHPPSCATYASMLLCLWTRGRCRTRATPEMCRRQRRNARMTASQSAHRGLNKYKGIL